MPAAESVYLGMTVGELAVAVGTLALAAFTGWLAWETRQDVRDTQRMASETARLATETERLAADTKRMAEIAQESYVSRYEPYLVATNRRTGEMIASIVSKVSFTITNVGAGPALNVKTWAAERTREGLVGKQAKALVTVPLIEAGESVDIVAQTAELDLTDMDSIFLTGGYFDRTEAGPHHNFPSEEWKRMFLPAQVAREAAQASDSFA